MPSPYIQLLFVNMLLAALISTTVFGAPILPAVAGALGAGALLYVRSKTTRAHKTSAVASAEAATGDHASSGGRRGSESATPTPALHEAGSGA